MNLFKRIKAWWEDRKDPFGKYAHSKDLNCDKISKSLRGEMVKRFFGHYCDSWDGLYICEFCDEFAYCTCFQRELDTKNNIILSEN